MGVACNISHGCRPLGSQQKGRKTNACEPKHLLVVVVVVFVVVCCCCGGVVAVVVFDAIFQAECLCQKR